MTSNELRTAQKERLIVLTNSLLQDPPRTLPELQERYQQIRGIIETVETDKDGLSRLLRNLDADFTPVRRLYPYHSEGFLNQPASVIANEYRFFVGGINAYIKTL